MDFKGPRFQPVAACGGDLGPHKKECWIPESKQRARSKAGCEHAPVAYVAHGDSATCKRTLIAKSFPTSAPQTFVANTTMPKAPPPMTCASGGASAFVSFSVYTYRQRNQTPDTPTPLWLPASFGNHPLGPAG